MSVGRLAWGSAGSARVAMRLCGVWKSIVCFYLFASPSLLSEALRVMKDVRVRYPIPLKCHLLVPSEPLHVHLGKFCL